MSLKRPRPQPFLAPERPAKIPRAQWRQPYDFFWALLRKMDLGQLGEVMAIFARAMDVLPADGPIFDTSYWQHHYLPVLLPVKGLTFHRPPNTGFHALAKAAEVELDLGTPTEVHRCLIASMRVAAVIAFVVDYRIRALVMVDDPRFIHEQCKTRPPWNSDVWAFFVAGGGDIARGYVDEMKAIQEQHRGARPDAHIAAVTRAREQDFVNLLVRVD